VTSVAGAVQVRGVHKKQQQQRGLVSPWLGSAGAAGQHRSSAGERQQQQLSGSTRQSRSPGCYYGWVGGQQLSAGAKVWQLASSLATVMHCCCSLEVMGLAVVGEGSPCR
jgi:hypothetical protein